MPAGAGQGCGQQVAVGSRGSARTATSLAGVLVVRCDSEKSRETLRIPSVTPHCPLTDSSSSRRKGANLAAGTSLRPLQKLCLPGEISASSCKLSDVSPRLTSPPPQHCSLAGKGIGAASCPPRPCFPPSPSLLPPFSSSSSHQTGCAHWDSQHYSLCATGKSGWTKENS